MKILFAIPGGMEWVIILFVLAILLVPIIAIVVLWRTRKHKKMPS